MLMAVEMWVKRDHDAEWKRWTGWLDHIAAQGRDRPRRDHGDRAAEGAVEQDAVAARPLGSREAGRRSATTVVRTLFDGEPRITHADAAAARPAIDGDGDRRLGHPLHDGRRRREDRRGPAARRADASRRHAGKTPAAARRPISPARGTCTSSTRVDVHSPLAAATAGERGRGRAPGRLRLPRSRRHDRRRQVRLRSPSANRPATRSRSRSPARSPVTRSPARWTWASTSARR